MMLMSTARAHMIPLGAIWLCGKHTQQDNAFEPPGTYTVI